MQPTLPPPTVAPSPPPTLHIPSGVTRIASFFPNGRFGWQVHYTLYFQIVCPLLMPGRLIAPAVLGGGKRADELGRDSLKDSDYCFPLSLIEALERKDFNLVLLVAGREGRARDKKKKHHCVSSIRFRKLISAFDNLLPRKTPPSERGGDKSLYGQSDG